MDLPPTQKGLSNASGVYAIELMIVVAMVGVIAGFAFLNLVQGNHTNYRQSTTVDFANYLQKVRLDSMRRNAKDINQMAQVKIFNLQAAFVVRYVAGPNLLVNPIAKPFSDSN